MNIKILAQNLVNNPNDFTAEEIERYFQGYAELRLNVEDNKNNMEIKNMKQQGVQTHQWGFYRISDNQLIATCIAKTYFEAVTYFEDGELLLDSLYVIKIIN